jgi:hypothetical protein
MFVSFKGGTSFKASSTIINSPLILGTQLPTAFWELKRLIGKSKLIKVLPQLIRWTSRSQSASFLASLMLGSFPLIATLLPSGCNTGSSSPWGSSGYAPSILTRLGLCNLLTLLSCSFTLFSLDPTSGTKVLFCILAYSRLRVDPGCCYL